MVFCWNFGNKPSRNRTICELTKICSKCIDENRVPNPDIDNKSVSEISVKDLRAIIAVEIMPMNNSSKELESKIEDKIKALKAEINKTCKLKFSMKPKNSKLGLSTLIPIYSV